MPLLNLFFGSIIGFSLGLTGGGGAIFAVPLLVYGLGVPPREAVGISLAAVGATALVGFVSRLRLGQVEVRTGLLFAVAGMLGAPVGSWVAGQIPERWLLMLFAGLMVVIAARLWYQSAGARTATECGVKANDMDRPTCRRDASGMLMLTSRCAALLFAIGLGTGFLTGLFGVGGGFIIVPALVMFSGMSIHRAIGTSLMVIALVSVSGVLSYILGGHSLPVTQTGLFVSGGIIGLFLGQSMASRLSGPALQRVFSVAILAVAVFMLVQNLAR